MNRAQGGRSATVTGILAARLIAALFCSIQVFAMTADAGDAGTIRTTRSGMVEGQLLESGIAAFRGIPFARPPVGELRWRPPLTESAWQGVRTAHQFGAACWQRHLHGSFVGAIVVLRDPLHVHIAYVDTGAQTAIETVTKVPAKDWWEQPVRRP